MNLVEQSLPAILGALSGAAFGLFGSHYLQYKLGARLQRVSALRHAFYDYLDLVADYWSGGVDGEARLRKEARLLAAQRTISIELVVLAKQVRRVRRARDATRSDRLSLWDAATGGCFQQAQWLPDPQRLNRAARAVGRIVKSLE